MGRQPKILSRHSKATEKSIHSCRLWCSFPQGPALQRFRPQCIMLSPVPLLCCRRLIACSFVNLIIVFHNETRASINGNSPDYDGMSATTRLFVLQRKTLMSIRMERSRRRLIKLLGGFFGGEACGAKSYMLAWVRLRSMTAARTPDATLRKERSK
jgi:hypothetical protein